MWLMVAPTPTPDLRPAAGVAPTLIAHRAGNHPELLRAAHELAVDVIEADVHVWGDRLELRHAKRFGPLPIYWDRGKLYGPTARGPRLESLLEECRPDVGLLLDLKGLDPRLPAAVERVLAAHAGDRAVIVCSRNWRHLERFRSQLRIEVMHSVGNLKQLEHARRRVAAQRVNAISIHQRLLTPAVAEELVSGVSRVWAWSVNTVPDMLRLQARGVSGLITDEPALLGRAGAL